METEDSERGRVTGMIEKRTKVKLITKINGESLIWPLRAGDTAAELNSKHLTLRSGCLRANYRHHTRSAVDHNMTVQRGKTHTLAVHVFTHQIYCLSTTGVSNTHLKGRIWLMEESNLAPLREKYFIKKTTPKWNPIVKPALSEITEWWINKTIH